MRRLGLRWAAVAVLAAAPSAWAQKYTTGSAESVPDSVPEATREMIDAQGVAVLAGDAAVVRFWMRAAPFEGEPVSAFGVRYDNIPEGAFLGVLEYPGKSSDYRDQSVPPGVYTLRFGLHPENGDHMGVAPSRDFALLSPVAKDLDIARNYEFEALMELSAEVGNPHPTVARLELPEGEDGPHLWENDYEHWVLDLKVADTVVGIVVDGHAEE